MLDLKSRLALAAEAWARAHADEAGEPAPLSRLSKPLAGDGKFFDNLPAMRRGPSTDTLEKFARFLADPANWPDGKVAAEAAALAHVVGVLPAAAAPGDGGDSAGDGPVSAGLSGDVSTEQEKAA